jgi:putative nucleotidyltransferase with HDIG domain
MVNPQYRKSTRRTLIEILVERQRGLRFLIAFLFVLILASFLHFREVRVDVLELEATAQGYIVAQIDFSFPDSEATYVLKQEAMKDIGNIYSLRESEIKKVRHRFEMNLINNPQWRKEHDATFEEMYNALDALVDTLKSANITDSRTNSKREELSLSQNNFYTATVLQADEPIILDQGFWRQVEKNVVDNYYYPKQTVNYIINFFEQHPWRLQNDLDAYRFFKGLVEKTIPEKNTSVNAGSKIIDQGEKVTERHLTMLSAMKKALADSKNLWQWNTILGSFLFALILTVMGALYLRLFQKEVYSSIRQVSLVVSIIVLTLFLSKFAEYLMLQNNHQLIDIVRYPIFVPFATILFCILMNRQISIVFSFVLTVILGITLAVEHGYFLFINLVTVITAIVSSRSLKKRKEIFTTAAKVWLSAVPIVIAFNLANSVLCTTTTITDFISAAICLFIVAMLLIGAMPLFESVFNVMTDISLMEYLDPSSDLLRRLAQDAPGTYHHSVTVSNLAESIASAIGANPVLVRVGAMYHDIGKTNNPHYYTENILLDASNTFDIHKLLLATESVQVIKSHVTEGEYMGRKYKLPSQIIDFIKQHHGTTLIKYFYHKQLEEIRGTKETVDEQQFRYPGPKPQSKEAAILMICDSVEATSRSLDEFSEANVRKMVEGMILDRIQDGQFDDCPLTFHELRIIKNKLTGLIMASTHARIRYPKKPESLSN